MSDHDYLKQKLYEAPHDTYSERGLEMGLTHACTYLDHVRNVPEQFKKEFEDIKAALHATPLSDSSGYLPRQLTPQQAIDLARRILGLYTEVMGGL